MICGLNAWGRWTAYFGRSSHHMLRKNKRVDDVKGFYREETDLGKRMVFILFYFILWKGEFGE